MINLHVKKESLKCANEAKRLPSYLTTADFYIFSLPEWLFASYRVSYDTNFSCITSKSQVSVLSHKMSTEPHSLLPSIEWRSSQEENYLCLPSEMYWLSARKSLSAYVLNAKASVNSVKLKWYSCFVFSHICSMCSNRKSTPMLAPQWSVLYLLRVVIA